MRELHGKPYWGWYVVLGAFMVMGVNYGARYSFGVFVQPMALDHGWSRSVVSAGMSVMVLAYGIGCIFAGRLIDRIAPRRIITAGSALMAAGLLLTGLVREPWQFYVSYGIFGGLGAACLGVVVCNSSVGKWFVRKRGLAIGLASIGVGAGTMAMTPLAGYVVKVYGWEAGFLCMGGIVLVVGVLLSQGLMGKTRPEDYGLHPDGAAEADPDDDPLRGRGTAEKPSLKPILADPRFWILSVCFSLAVLAEMSVMVHQVAYALDRNIDRVAAASSLGVIGMASILGRFFFGWLSDRIRDAKHAAALGFLLMAAGMVLLMKVTSPSTLLLYALLFGFGYGSISVTMPFLLADRFGRDVLGTVFGMQVFFVAGLGGGLGPLITGALYDASGTYTRAWLLDLVLLLFVTLLILALKPRRTGPP